MAPPINLRREVTAQPWVISSVDTRVAAYIAALPSPSIHSDTATTEWGFAIGGLDGAPSGGTSYLVSAEAMRHIQTERF